MNTPTNTKDLKAGYRIRLDEMDYIQHQDGSFTDGRLLDFFPTGKEGERAHPRPGRPAGVRGLEFSCTWVNADGDVLESRLWIYEDGCYDED